MKKHLYNIDITPISDKEGNDCSHLEHINFDFACHDDLNQIIARVNTIEGITDQERMNFILGLKLLGEVMLEHRKHPLFEEFSKSFGQFMKKLKSQIKENEQEHA